MPLCRSYPIALLAGLGFLAPQPEARAATYDVIIRGGTIYDGRGGAPFPGDVALQGDRIAAVGPLGPATATREIDARGLVVAPGFVDGHSHAADRELVRPELAGAEALLAQGVTTVFINPDGWGLSDLAAQRALIEQARPGVNVAPMIGHKPVRTAVVGLAARAPTPAELDRMRAMVRTAFERDGAFGLSTGLIYPPASFAKTDELLALAKVAAEFGGFYHSHIRDESDNTVGRMVAIEELLTIAREARVTGIVTHIKGSGPRTWGRAGEVIQRLEAARAAGIAVWADQYPYEAGATVLSAIVLPAWAQDGGMEQTRVRLADPATRARIRTEMIANFESRGGAGALLISEFEPDRSVQGLRLDEIGRRRKMEPVDVAIGMIEKGEPRAIAFSIRMDDILEFMRQPWTMTASDGFGVAEAHPRSYGTFPRKLRVFALDQKVISLERAIHSMTGQPAEVLGLRDRGVLRAKALADVVVFDPARLRDVATYEQPRGRAEGMVHVFVNGQAAVSGGKYPGTRAGRVLSRRD